jgi:ferredoxin
MHIDPNQCKACGMCAKSCPFGAIVHMVRPCKRACPANAISYDENGLCVIDDSKCIHCGHCIHACPFGAIGSKIFAVDVINAIKSGKRVIAVELDPPVDDEIDFFVDGVRALRDAGADAVTIADCPIGRPRADSSILAAKIRRELGVEPLPHMTCRDRNLNATKALLLGLSIEGVHNVLLVTGDPIPSENRDEVKSVFNFNSRKLARFVSSLN